MGTTTFVEVEDKYSADDSLRLPALLGLPSVARVGQPHEVTLEATYYDTADLRLAARGITLRRRTGGEDAGWHLKLPLPDGSRQELHRPLGSSRRSVPAVPAALLRPVRAYVRDASTQPVARLKTQRTVRGIYAEDDRLLAELADDRVTAEIMGDELTVSAWREVEVELMSGERDLLAAIGALLTAAGARSDAGPSKLARALGDRLPPSVGDAPPSWPKRSTAGFAVLAYLREHVDALLTADAAVREDRDDSVHKMRVATRRIRSLLATYRPLFDQSVTEPLRAELKWIGGLLGGARDVEVMHAHLIRILAELSPELTLGPVRARVDAELTAEYQAARRSLLQELNGTRYFTLLDSLDALIRTPSLTPAATE
ncbi:MAG: CYTH and CHAD domain-containing protein, partial [Mycobacteriales bacterium]